MNRASKRLATGIVLAPCHSSPFLLLKRAAPRGFLPDPTACRLTLLPGAVTRFTF